MPARFEQIARIHADRTAIGSGDWQPTFAELNDAANQFAHRVFTLPGNQGDRLAILMRHDGPLIAAILGALKAGRVVAVLNPSDPESALSRLLADSEPTHIVTDLAHRDLATSLAGNTFGVLNFSDLQRESTQNPDLPIAPEQLAFLTYTSGSTGMPKAVMQPHRNVIHNAGRLAAGLEIVPKDRTVLLGSTNGGQGLATLWSSLLAGAAICPFPVMERGIAVLADWLEDRRITIWVSAASLFRHFVQVLDPLRRFSGVRLVRLGSEPATERDVDAWRSHFDSASVLMHTYSSSETGNVSQARINSNSRAAKGRLPIGRAVEGMELLLLDERGNEISEEGTGELGVRSRYLSPGYWRREALTAERFLETGSPERTRMFLTGDLASRDEHGDLVISGRADNRVKVRGYRIELSAIERALLLIRGVDRVTVRVRAASSEDARIVAFVILRSGATQTPQILRAALRESLPRHMIPAAFMFLDSFPLTPHGKIDGLSLDRLDPWADESASIDPPSTPTEKMLALAWESVFRLGAVGRDAEFFDLGGDSLLAAVVAARVYAATGVEIDLRFFAEHPKLQDFATALDRRKGELQEEVLPKLHRVSRDAPLPLSFGQERIWRFCQSPEQSASYTVACSYHLVGRLDLELFRRCLDEVAQKHEVLRTTFEQSGAEPVQRVHPPAPLDIPLIDLSDQPDAADRAAHVFEELMITPFDLQRLPLLRFALVRISECEHRLFRANHHIVSDSWSWRLFFNELATLYEAHASGRASPLREEQRLQYADYATWQRRRLDRTSMPFRDAIQWWKSNLSGAATPLDLPVRRSPGVHAAKPEDGLIWWGLDNAISQRLESLARARGATYFTIRLAAFAIQLAWETESEEVVLGTYATNRMRLETQNMFGFFANLATLRLRVMHGQTFAQALARTQRLVSEVQARSEIPYEELCEQLTREGISPPEIRAIFSLSDHRAPVRLGNAELSWDERRVRTMPWGFSLAFDPNHETNRCSVMFDAHRYDPEWVKAFLHRYVTLLDAVSRNADVACWPDSVPHI